MREDYIAALDPHSGSILNLPDQPLSPRSAGCGCGSAGDPEPPSEPGCRVQSRGCKWWTILPLSRGSSRIGASTEQPGPLRGAVHFRLSWRDRLWRNLDPGYDNLISAEDVAQIGDVNQLLRGYYAERVVASLRRPGAPSASCASGSERKLITETGIRSQVLMGQSKRRAWDIERHPPIRERTTWQRAEKRRGVTGSSWLTTG